MLVGDLERDLGARAIADEARDRDGAVVALEAFDERAPRRVDDGEVLELGRREPRLGALKRVRRDCSPSRSNTASTASTSPFRSGLTVRTFPCPRRSARVCIEPARTPPGLAAPRTAEEHGSVGKRRGDEEPAHRYAEEREAADRDRGTADEGADEVRQGRDAADGADSRPSSPATLNPYTVPATVRVATKAPLAANRTRVTATMGVTVQVSATATAAARL